MRKIVRTNTGSYNRSRLLNLFSLPKQEQQRLARAKVIEELLEVEETPSAEELGDLADAVVLLARVYDFNQSEVGAARLAKKKRRGDMGLVFEQWEAPE